MSYYPTAPLGDIIKTEQVELIESEGIELAWSPETDPDDEPLHDIRLTLDSESCGRVAALVELVEELAQRESDPVARYKLIEDCLPSRMAMARRKLFTVVGSYADEDGGRWADTVLAEDARQAEALVAAGLFTDSPVEVAGVIEGEVEVVA